MKVITPKQMAYLESQSYRNGCRDYEFMENAGSGVAEQVQKFVEERNLERHVLILCGKGNNAGDAYVAGCELLDKGYTVIAYQVFPLEDSSPLCQKNAKRFFEKGTLLQELQFPSTGVILDGLFGTGFRGFVQEPFLSVIQQANNSGLPIISIDIPSGLQGETGLIEGLAIRAEMTCFLGLPKMGFFLNEGWNHVGKLEYVDFGLPSHYVDEAEFEADLLDFKTVKSLLPKIVRNRHKYQSGYVVGLGGSENMPGAPQLSSLASLRGGAGIVKLLHPENMKQELCASALEIIKVPFAPQESVKVLELMQKANSTFVGPGLGRSKETIELLQKILPLLERPCVIDADALTLIAEENLPIPKQAIFTPHVGEMNRLLKGSGDNPGTKAFLKQCQQYAEVHKITLLLKGGPSFLFHSGDPVCVSGYGDPGMATAGSGDVLTGVLAGLLSQGLALKNAAKLGLYLHGVAGEIAAKCKTSHSMIASDIIHFLPTAFQTLS